ncbi:autotransporter domain-containing protein [Hansschlegelia beijingensis]
MSCPTFSKGYAGGDAVLTEGECGYFKIGGRRTSDDGDGERGRSRLKAAFWQVGGQIEISPGLFLGGSAAYQADWFNGHDGVSGKGSTGQAAITLKRQDGPILWTAAVFGNIGELDLKRRISVAGFSDTAKGAPTLFSGGLRGRVAHTFGTEDLYLRPYLNVDLIYARSGSFKERGAGDLGLAYGAARYKTATFTPAVELGGRSVLSDDLVLRSFVTAGASVRTNDRWRGKAHLRGARNVEEMSLTAPIDSVAAKVGVGLQLFHGERADLRLRYDGEFGSHAKSHGATASVAYRF